MESTVSQARHTGFRRAVVEICGDVDVQLRFRIRYRFRTEDGDISETLPYSAAELADEARLATGAAFELLTYERVAHRLVDQGMPAEQVAGLMRNLLAEVLEDIN